MKKIRKISVLLFVVSTAVFVLFKIYEKTNADSIPPEITFATEELTVSVDVDESALLADVKAEDNRSGDISDLVVVERLSAFTEEGVRMITYAVVDESGNVTKKTRTLRYSDYEPPRFVLTDDLRFPVGGGKEVLGCIGAESTLDGDISEVIKYSLGSSIDTSTVGSYSIEFRVMDSVENTIYLATEVEIYDSTKETINVELTDYLVYLKTGETFNAYNYYVGASVEGTLNIESSVDSSVEGVYSVDYVVSSGNYMGKSRLIVVVEK